MVVTQGWLDAALSTVGIPGPLGGGGGCQWIVEVPWTGALLSTRTVCR